MNSDTLIQSLQTGFRVAVGATASLLEMIQDPQKRDENFNKLSSDLNELTQQWAEKGEMTEREARNFVENIVHHPDSSPSSNSSADAPSSTATPSATSPSDPEAQRELQELTEQIATLRAELEKLREQDSES